jgi:hypothetical protein
VVVGWGGRRQSVSASSEIQPPCEGYGIVSRPNACPEVWISPNIPQSSRHGGFLEELTDYCRNLHSPSPWHAGAPSARQSLSTHKEGALCMRTFLPASAASHAHPRAAHRREPGIRPRIVSTCQACGACVCVCACRRNWAPGGNVRAQSVDADLPPAGDAYPSLGG